MITGFFQRPVEIDILPMESRHCEGAAAVHLACFARPWGAEEIDGLLAQSNVHGVVAQPLSRRHPVAGFVLARSAADEAEILTIAVAERWQRRGLGWRLMVAAIGRMREADAQTMFLEVDEANQAAIGLYHRLGFGMVGKRHAYYRQKHGAPTAALVMRLDLR